jgi:amphi-Trp domain-containing protein
MELLEITQKESLRREVVAQRLHALADALSRHNDVEFQRGGLQFKVKVPDEIQLKVELEVGDDGVELEIEMSW